MTNDDQQRAPSELSLDIFVTNVAADETLPPALRSTVSENKGRKVSEFLAALRQAIGDIR